MTCLQLYPMSCGCNRIKHAAGVSLLLGNPCRRCLPFSVDVGLPGKISIQCIYNKTELFLKGLRALFRSLIGIILILVPRERKGGLLRCGYFPTCLVLASNYLLLRGIGTARCATDMWLT